MKSLVFAFLIFTGSLFAQPKLGLNFTPHGVKAAHIATHPKFGVAPLPASDTSLEPYFYFDNQGNIGACGPNSSKEAVDCIFQRDHQGAHCMLSRLDIYQRTLVAEGQFPQDAGVNNDTMLSVLKTGALLETTLPYITDNLGTLPTETPQTKAERAAHLVIKGYVVPFNDNGVALKNCIHNLRIPVIIGRLWSTNQFTETLVGVKTKDATGKVITVQRHVIARYGGDIAGGHDIPALAYDDNMIFPDGAKGGVEIHNHWAKDEAQTIPWGDARGSAWMSYRDAFSLSQNDDWIALEQTNIAK